MYKFYKERTYFISFPLHWNLFLFPIERYTFFKHVVLEDFFRIQKEKYGVPSLPNNMMISTNDKFCFIINSF